MSDAEKAAKPVQMAGANDCAVVYSNAAQIVFSAEDATFVFGIRDLNAPETVHATIRVCLSLPHAKRILSVLSQQIARYEGLFGEIDADPIASLSAEAKQALQNE
jgi:hypothetical protein